MPAHTGAKPQRNRRESVSTAAGIAAERRTLAERRHGAAMSAARQLTDSARRDAIASARDGR